MYYLDLNPNIPVSTQKREVAIYHQHVYSVRGYKTILLNTNLN